MSEQVDVSRYYVVVNGEEQYSVWPVDRELPLGWRAVGKEGARAECLAYIEEVWTDMRPLSLREKTERDCPAVAALPDLAWISSADA